MREIRKKRVVIISIATHSLEAVIASIFKKFDYRVCYAKNYYEVIKKSGQSNVTDIVVGGTIGNYDSLTAARRIKAFDNNNSKKVIIVNVNFRTPNIREYNKNNIYFIPLPFNSEHIIKIIKKKKRNTLKGKKILYLGDNKKDIETLLFLKTKYSFELVKKNTLENIENDYSVIIADCEKNEEEMLSGIKKIRCLGHDRTPIIIVNDSLNEKEYIQYGVCHSNAIDKKLMESISRYFLRHIKSADSILVISNDLFLNAFLDYCLRSNGYSVRVAKNFSECEYFINHKNIATLIVNAEKDVSHKTIIDLYMPSEEKPLIILSEKSDFVLNSENERYHFDLLKKPFEEHDLLKSVKASLLTRQMIDNLEYQNQLQAVVNKNNMQMLAYGASQIITPSLIIENYASRIKGDAAFVIKRQSVLIQRIIDVMTNYQALERCDTILMKTKEDIAAVFSSAEKENSVLLDSKNIKTETLLKENIPYVVIDRKIIEKVFSSILLYIYHSSLPKRKIVFNFAMLDYQDESDVFTNMFATNQSELKLNIEVSFIIETDKIIDENEDKSMFDFVLSTSKRYLELHNGRLFKYRKENYEHIIMLVPV